MALCRYLPIPSDRMGVLWSLLNISDAVVLEYGPSGTTHFGAGYFMKVGIRQSNRYFTTHMSEDDVVMGDVNRLEMAITELDQDYSPNIIFVVASSISAVIGTDLKGVCSYMQDKVNATLITFENAGLRGDYSAGLIDTYSLIAESLVEECTEKKPNSYNIIGASFENYRAVSDVNEIKDLMKTAFGFENHTSLCTTTTLKEISSMASVSFNLVISYEGIKAAKYMEEKFNIPYIYGAPYGYKGTLNWLCDVAKLTGKELPKEMSDAIQEKVMEAMVYSRYSMMRDRAKEQSYAYIYADYDRLLGLSAILKELSIETRYQICKHSLKNISDADENIKNISEEKERIDILKDNKKMLVLADDISNAITDESNFTLRVSTPIERGTQIATHLPFMGIKGADFVRETVDRYLGKFF